MIIKDSLTIKELQSSFNQMFSGLKIEFYKTKHDGYVGSHKKDQLHPDQVIRNIRSVHTKGDITIDPGMSVLVFEQLFEDKFGLNVQVFRKSGDVWLQTSVTDYLTLEIQNRKAFQSATV